MMTTNEIRQNCRIFKGWSRSWNGQVGGRTCNVTWFHDESQVFGVSLVGQGQRNDRGLAWVCVWACVSYVCVCLRVCTCVCVCARPCSFFNVHVRVSACPSSSRRVLCSRRRDFYQHTHVLALPLHGGGPFISNTYVYVYMHVCMHAYHFLSLFNSINFCLTFNYSYFLHYSSL